MPQHNQRPGKVFIGYHGNTDIPVHLSITGPSDTASAPIAAVLGVRQSGKTELINRLLRWNLQQGGVSTSFTLAGNTDRRLDPICIPLLPEAGLLDPYRYVNDSAAADLLVNFLEASGFAVRGHLAPAPSAASAIAHLSDTGVREHLRATIASDPIMAAVCGEWHGDSGRRRAIFEVSRDLFTEVGRTLGSRHGELLRLALSICATAAAGGGILAIDDTEALSQSRSMADCFGSLISGARKQRLLPIFAAVDLHAIPGSAASVSQVLLCSNGSIRSAEQVCELIRSSAPGENEFCDVYANAGQLVLRDANGRLSVVDAHLNVSAY